MIVRGYFLLKLFYLKNQVVHEKVDGTDTEIFYTSADSLAILSFYKGLNLSVDVNNRVQCENDNKKFGHAASEGPCPHHRVEYYQKT